MYEELRFLCLVAGTHNFRLNLKGILNSTGSLYFPAVHENLLLSCCRMLYITFDSSNWFDKFSFYEHWHSVIVTKEVQLDSKQSGLELDFGCGL